MRLIRYVRRSASAASLVALAGCGGPARLGEFGGFTTSDGVTIAAELDAAPGRPRPLILLGHQLGTDRRSWDPLVPRLVEAGFSVLRVDRRGHGASTQEAATPADLTGPQRSNHPLDLVEAIPAVRDRPEVDSSRIGIVASEFSVHAAVRCAMEHPDRVAALVLMSGTVPGDEERWLMDQVDLPVLLIAAKGHFRTWNVVRQHADRLRGRDHRFVEFEPVEGVDDARWIGTDGLRDETGLADLITWFLQEHVPAP